MTRADVRAIWSAIALVSCAAGLALAQNRPAGERRPTGRVIGVYDDRTGQPIDSAEVRDIVSGASALTTSTGTLSLFFVDTAGSLLRIRKVGYAPITTFVPNFPDLPPLTITLEPVAQNLPTVVTRGAAPKWISPGLRSFEERRTTGMGYFLPDSVLRKENDRAMSNVLRAHVPSIDIWEMPGGGGRIWVVMSRRTTPPCAVDVYVDGMPFGLSAPTGAIQRTGQAGRGAGSNRPPTDINQFQVNDFAAVEYHNIGDTPPEYNRTAGGCGVLLLWTRER